MSTIDVQAMIKDFAQYMQNRDAFTAAYALVCNPARQFAIIEIMENEADKNQPLTHVEIMKHYHKPIATHEWCPVETIYLPQSKDDLDKLMADLDEYGAKMRGEVCIMAGCHESTSESWTLTDQRRMGMCAKHIKAIDDSFKNSRPSDIWTPPV